MKDIKLWLPLIIMLVTVGASWGANQAQISNIKEDVKELKVESKTVIQVDERTKAIQKEQEQLRDMIKQILREVKK